MAETHLFQHLLMLAGMLWWNKQWMINRPVARWRFGVAALVSIIGWVYVAYTALQSAAGSSGVVILYGSESLAYFSAFMVFTSIIGAILGLVLWTEEEAEDASQDIPQSVRSRLGGD